MENYTKVEKPIEKTEKNELRVTAKGSIRNNLGYAENILKEDGEF